MHKTILNRFSNFELLRIFAMFLIVLHHLIVHSKIFQIDNILNINIFNRFAIAYISYSGKVGVILFVLIMGYFLVDKTFKLEKILKLYLQMLFYSIFIYFVWILINPIKINLTLILKSYFPFSQNSYWFITLYILLYAFHPLLNAIMHHAKPNAIKYCLLLTTFLYFFSPKPIKLNYFDSSLLYFIYLYILGASIKLNYIKLNTKKLLLIALIVAIYFFTKIKPSLLTSSPNLFIIFKEIKNESFGSLITSLIIFNIFSHIKIQSTYVNNIAKSTLGVYLIHENIFIRPFLWNNVLKIGQIYTNPIFIIYSLLISAIVFAICILIDKILSKIYNPLINYVIKSTTNFIKQKK